MSIEIDSGHYARASEALATLDEEKDEWRGDLLAQAQVHATLALVEAVEKLRRDVRVDMRHSFPELDALLAGARRRRSGEHHRFVDQH